MKKFFWLPAIVAIGLGALIAIEAGNSSNSSDSSAPPAKEGETVTTKSGLEYTELKVGDGPEAKKGKTVEVHYTGWLADKNKQANKEKKFDSNQEPEKPFSFPLGAGRVIKGWDEGVAGMKVGGKRRLYIPSKLGYEERGAGNDIPPNADLVFEVELLKVR